MLRVSMRVRLSVALGLGVLACSRGARAGNDDEILVGNKASMAGGAVTARVSDASSIWYNPAGLAGDKRDKIDVSATAYSLRSYAVPKFLSNTSGASKDGAVTEFISVPTQIAYVRRLSPDWSLGLGYFAPHVTNYVLREGLGEENIDASQWQVSATVAETQHIAAAAIGGTIAPNVRFGVSLIGGYSTITQAFSLFASIKNNGATQALSSGAYFATSWRLSGEIGAGGQWEMSPDVTLGVAVRSPRLQIYRDTDVSLSESYAIGGAMPYFTAYADHPKNAQAGFDMLLAGRAVLAFSYRLGQGWIASELDVQPGVGGPNGEVNRKPVLNARLGVYHPIARSIALGAGLFTDRSPDPTRGVLLSGNGDFYGGTVGIEFKSQHDLAPTEPVDSLVFSSVFALRYAYSNGSFGRPVGDPASTVPFATPFRVENGSLIVHELAFYVGSGLHF